MEQSCNTCATVAPDDRCPFHTEGARKLLSKTMKKAAADACPQCGQPEIDLLDGFYDTENRAWHASCAVIALRAL